MKFTIQSGAVVFPLTVCWRPLNDTLRFRFSSFVSAGSLDSKFEIVGTGRTGRSSRGSKCS